VEKSKKGHILNLFGVCALSKDVGETTGRLESERDQSEGKKERMNNKKDAVKTSLIARKKMKKGQSKSAYIMFLPNRNSLMMIFLGTASIGIFVAQHHSINRLIKDIPSDDLSLFAGFKLSQLNSTPRAKPLLPNASPKRGAIMHLPLQRAKPSIRKRNEPLDGDEQTSGVLEIWKEILGADSVEETPMQSNIWDSSDNIPQWMKGTIEQSYLAHHV
jgi:hypothetical protein